MVIRKDAVVDRRSDPRQKGSTERSTTKGIGGAIHDKRDRRSDPRQKGSTERSTTKGISGAIRDRRARSRSGSRSHYVNAAVVATDGDLRISGCDIE
jgi:hypothetical protein